MNRPAGALLVVVLLLLAGCGGGADPGDSAPSPTTDGTEATTAPSGSTTDTTSTGSDGSGSSGTVERTTAAESTQTESGTPTRTATATRTGTATPAAQRTATVSVRTSWEVQVIRVIDGDTFEVEFPDGHTENVRLLGVDTPEVHVENDPDEFEGIPDTSDGRSWLRDWGHRASELARAELAGETVRIETDPEADRRGSYGRLLVYVYAEGQNFNLDLIEQGYARMYDSTFSDRSRFASAESTARDEDVGLWGYEGATTRPTATASDGSGGGALSVVTVHADAAGNDNENLNDEYVVFENTGDDTLDLTGWTLRDSAGHAYVFPDGFTLGPDETVTVHTGSGTDSETALYWGSGSAIWNNGGDTVVVTDGDGTVVIEYEYS